jgi:H+/Cl- antiporter ClcA
MIKRIWSETNEYVGGDLKSKTVGFLFGHYFSLMIASFAMYFIQRNIGYYAFGLRELVFFILFGPVIQVIGIFCMWFFSIRHIFNQKRKEQGTEDKWEKLRKSFDDTY